MKIDDNNQINGSTRVCDIDIVKNQKNISEDFFNIFQNNDDLIVNKIPNMFDYYLKIIFKYIKKDIEKYQEISKSTDKNGDNQPEKNENGKIYLDEKIVTKLDEIFSNKDIIIKKESMGTAIRLFISLVLYREEEKDKDKRIKANRKNIIDYLKGKDLWETGIYKDSGFEQNLDEIKSLDIKIKEILWFYYYLTNNKDEGFEDEVKEYKMKLEEEEKRKQKEKEKREKEEKEDEENRKNRNRRRRNKVQDDDEEEEEDKPRRRKKKNDEDDDEDDNKTKRRHRKRKDSD
jgi:hypothetical protein